MKNTMYLIILVLVMSGCNPLDRKYNEENLEKDMKAIGEKVDTTETALLLGTILRYKFQNKSLEGLTYKELIEDGKAFKEEQDKLENERKVLAEQAEKEELEKVKRLNESLTVAIFDKSYAEYDYQKYLTYKFVFRNKTNKDILGFTGEVIFNDLFDKPIKKLQLSYDDGVKANATVNWSATTDYNQFRDEDIALKSKDLDKIKLEWNPEKILFKDGTVLE